MKTEVKLEIIFQCQKKCIKNLNSAMISKEIESADGLIGKL